MSEEKKDYKNTLFMPQTPFEMKADLQKKEIYYKDFGLKNKVYRRLLEKNRGKKRYLLHDGPPYANGNIHIGHALNKILKDFVVRSKSMQGFFSPFVAGGDCHGLPIENKMLSEIKRDHKQLDVIYLRKQAKLYAEEQVRRQKQQFSRLLLLSDLEDHYITLTPDYESRQLKIFKKMFNEGLIYRDLKPVFGSTSSLSALAEGEVEYKEKFSDSAYILFELAATNQIIGLEKGVKLIIGTTQPGTLISNSAVALKDDVVYTLVKCGSESFVLAKQQFEKLKKSLLDRANTSDSDLFVVKEFFGRDLLGLKYRRPIFDELAPVLNSDHADDRVGSGIVHISPAFGEEDFSLYKIHNLEFIMHVNDDGTINEAGGKYSGLKYGEANKIIRKDLESLGCVLKGREDFLHSYPHDWRTDKPIIYRATRQGFVSIESIKEKIKEGASSVKYYRSGSKKRLMEMLGGRKSGTISRQRSWGVPIPIFFDSEGRVANNDEIFDYVIDLISKEGTDCGFSYKTDELLPEKYRGLNGSRELDIMDVGFDSGSSFYSANINEESPPFELYLEGSDQFRGWFNSSMINSIIFLGKSPYKELLPHGFVLDEKGNKMSKSKGNVVDPLKVCDSMGAEILRLGVAQSDFTSDLLISDHSIKQVKENYRKIRNIFRFLLGNLKGYELPNNVDFKGIHSLFNERFRNLIFKVITHYENLEFYNVIKSINSFFSELSSYYLSLAKDVIYIELANNFNKQQMLANFFLFCDGISKLLAPILPVTMEEVFFHFKGKSGQGSIHLEEMPKKPNSIVLSEERRWEEFFALKSEIYRLIERGIKEGKFKRSAQVSVTIPKPSEFLKSEDLRFLLMVGEVRFGESISVEPLKDAEKCLRCGNFFKNEKYNENLKLCFKCCETLSLFK